MSPYRIPAPPPQDKPHWFDRYGAPVFVCGMLVFFLCNLVLATCRDNAPIVSSGSASGEP